MADMITMGYLQIKCCFVFLSVFQCDIYSKYGEHTRTEIIGTVKVDEAKKAFLNILKDNLEVIARNDDGTKETLFIGVIESLDLKQEGQYAVLTVRAISNTCKIDIERKNRSFQNLSLTYRDVVEEVLRKYDVDDMSWNLPDQALKHPLIQWRETDFCFLKRILSHLGGSVIIADTETNISLSMGLRNDSHSVEVDLKNRVYSVVLSRDKRLVGYKIENMHFARVGDALSIEGKTFYVMESTARFIKNVLDCTCIVFPKQCFNMEWVPADTLRGAVLIGTVLKAEQEGIKLHLDIDKEQDIDGAYEFPWKPITGNLLYCMPEKGSKVALYFGEGKEKSATAIYNIREIDEKCEQIADCNNRYFTTKHEKKMYLNSSEAGFANLKEQNAEILLRDNCNLEVKSHQKISITAEGQIRLKGKKIKIIAPLEATLVKKDILAPTVINLCNAFDAVGSIGDFTPISTKVKEDRKKRIKDASVERYSLEGTIETIISNIPMAEMESPIMKAVAGSMPVISRITT